MSEPTTQRLFIPACGDRLRLTAPWRFTLVFEHRNVKFAQVLGVLKKEAGWNVYTSPNSHRLASAQAELPAGMVVECDRIYVRQFNRGRIQLEQDYDSVTWRVHREKGKAGKDKPHGRFWVKLPDCYTMEYALDDDSLYRDRVKLVKAVHDF